MNYKIFNRKLFLNLTLLNNTIHLNINDKDQDNLQLTSVYYTICSLFLKFKA